MFGKIIYLDAKFAEEFVSLVGVQRLAGGELDTELLFEGLDHVVALPWTLEIEHELPSTLLALVSVGVVGNSSLATGERLLTRPSIMRSASSIRSVISA